MKIFIDESRFFQIDEQDAALVSRYKWRVTSTKKRTKFYIANHQVGYLHRLIMGVYDPYLRIDHKNGDTLDNRRENLRYATNSQNMNNKVYPTHELRHGKYRVRVRCAGDTFQVSGIRKKEDADIIRKFLVETFAFKKD